MSKQKKLIRQQFRDAVFRRDNYKCTICSAISNLDAHHIVNRNKMPNGGYILSNGITLCGIHHLQAEQGVITARELYALQRKV